MPNTQDPDYLFVYGTLKKGFNNALANELSSSQTFMGEGFFPGQLFSVSFFPGAVYIPESTEKVYGQVFKLTQNKDELIAALDHYEGYLPDQPEASEFKRAIIPINLGQKVISAFVYLYNKDYSTHTPIPSGTFKPEMTNQKI